MDPRPRAAKALSHRSMCRLPDFVKDTRLPEGLLRLY
jgi:hypothetical protein